jgi:archaellum component FlaC
MAGSDGRESRLDRIERILEQAVERGRMTDQRLDGVTERLNGVAERLDRLTERHEALAQAVELLSTMHRDNEQRFAQLADVMTRLIPIQG